MGKVKLTKAQERIVRANDVARKLAERCFDVDGCWVFGADGGYRTISTPTGTRKAHRVSYEIFCGPVPDGLNVCHHCDRPACVNPSHLFVGTNSDNVRDMLRKGRGKSQIDSRQSHFKAGRAPRGEEASGAILTEPLVKEILLSAANGELTIAIARRHGVNRTTVQRLLRGETWRHLPRPPGLPRDSGRYGRAALKES